VEGAAGDGLEALEGLERRLEAVSGVEMTSDPLAESVRGGRMALWEVKMGRKSSIPPVLRDESMLEISPRARKGLKWDQKGGENGQNACLTAVSGRFRQQQRQ
jgi:hypothetical protein